MRRGCIQSRKRINWVKSLYGEGMSKNVGMDVNGWLGVAAGVSIILRVGVGVGCAWVNARDNTYRPHPP